MKKEAVTALLFGRKKSHVGAPQERFGLICVLREDRAADRNLHRNGLATGVGGESPIAEG